MAFLVMNNILDSIETNTGIVYGEIIQNFLTIICLFQPYFILFTDFQLNLNIFRVYF